MTSQSKIDGLLGRIVRSLFRDRLRWTFAFIGIALISLFSLSRIQLGLDAKDFLPGEPVSKAASALSALHEKVALEFGGKSPTVIVLSAEERIVVEKIAPLIESLAERLTKIDTTQSVRYRLEAKLDHYIDTDLRKQFLLYLSPKDLQRFSEKISPAGLESHILGDEKKQGLRRLFNRDPLGMAQIAQPYFFDLLTGYRIAFVDRYFASRDQRAFFILIEPKTLIKNAKDAKAITGQIDGVIEAVKRDPQFESLLKEIAIAPLGRPYLYASTFDTTLRDAQEAIYYSGLSIFILLILLYRRLIAAFAIMLTVLMGLIVTAGLGAALYPSVNLFSLLFAAVLAGLGVDFSIHIGTHYWLNTTDIVDREAALMQSVLRPGRGILFGALTTAAAFSALAFSQYSGIAQTGILTAIGMMTMLLASITLFPFLLSLSQKQPPPQQGMHRWTALFVRLSEGYPRAGLVFWILLAIVASVGVMRVRYEDHPWSVAVRGNKDAEALLALTERIGMSFTPILVVSQGKSEAEAIEKDRQVAQMLRQIRKPAGIAFFHSISSLLPEAAQQRDNMAFIRERPELFSAERFRRDFHAVLKKGNIHSDAIRGPYTERIARVLESADREAIQLDDLRRAGLGPEIGRFVGALGDTHLAISSVYLKQFPWVKGVVKQFSEAFERAGGGKIEGVSLTGEGMQSVSHAHLLKREVLQVGLIALFWVAFILALAFRKLSLLAMTLLPLLSSVWLTLGIVGYLGIEMNFLTLSLTPILLGIGIDDGLHIMDRFRRGDSLRTLLKETGSGLTATSFTTAFAFLSFCIAENEVVREYGFVAALGIGICLLASLHLLPCIFSLSKGNRS